ncbi:hypothetical protein MO293_18415 [Clostridioides difficile]|nr:hypothetical protein [Clostridioides difficile]HBF3596701.1 hypothetical protein [Clostridioides difficile]HBF3732655.1 hypothetical protein [Clostridioides difficile]HBF9885409.1 hypothetical protein [Clostridioides difficile]HBY2707228.1 hypothetical protein [Clostridioides difficile]
MEKGVISSKKDIELLLQKHGNEYVVNAVNKYKAMEHVLKNMDSVIKEKAERGSKIDYEEYIYVLKLFLLGEDSEVLALNNKIANLKSSIEAKDTEIINLKCSIKDKYVTKKSYDSYKKRSKEHYRKILGAKDTEIAELQRKEANLNRGKKHIRGTEEFYRDVKESCSLIVSKVNKSGKQYNDYREAVKYAKTCNTIVNYSNANKVKINRENLQNWLSVAIALAEGVETEISVGKYNANKGYKK